MNPQPGRSITNKANALRSLRAGESVVGTWYRFKRVKLQTILYGRLSIIPSKKKKDLIQQAVTVLHLYQHHKDHQEPIMEKGCYMELLLSLTHQDGSPYKEIYRFLRSLTL